jgi:hypothetical protein
VDFITAHRSTGQCQLAAYPRQLLVRSQRGFHRQPAQACAAARLAFQAQRVVQLLPQHLQATTNANQLAAIRR